jgi:hypothetical protein
MREDGDLRGTKSHAHPVDGIPLPFGRAGSLTYCSHSRTRESGPVSCQPFVPTPDVTQPAAKRQCPLPEENRRERGKQGALVGSPHQSNEKKEVPGSRVRETLGVSQAKRLGDTQERLMQVETPMRPCTEGKLPSGQLPFERTSHGRCHARIRGPLSCRWLPGPGIFCNGGGQPRALAGCQWRETSGTVFLVLRDR